MFSGLSVFPGSLSFYIGGHMVMIVVVHDVATDPSRRCGTVLYCSSTQ